MSVVGVGLDLVDIEAFAAQLEDRASTFVDTAFTTREREDARRSATAEAISLAARFAAKEAFIKAWSVSRLGRAPVRSEILLGEIEVLSDAAGRPWLCLSPGLADAVDRDGPLQAVVSLTHDGPCAAAVVLLQRVDAKETF